MHLHGYWTAPKAVPSLTDIEFVLKSGEHIMVSWESATFGKRDFHASGVSTTDDSGKVTTGNLGFLRENIESLERVHYLTSSAAGSHVKSVVFEDTVRGKYKSETWTFVNKNYLRGESNGNFGFKKHS